MANLNSIFDQDNYQKWLCAMNGYAYVSSVYEGIYDHLKRGGHLIRALDDKNIKKLVSEKVIQNIVIAYIEDFEKLEDESSMIHQLLERRNHQEIDQLIWFVWTLRKKGDTKVQDKVFALWPRILDVINTTTREGKKLASKLCTWSVFIDDIKNSWPKCKNLILNFRVTFFS